MYSFYILLSKIMIIISTEVNATSHDAPGQLYLYYLSNYKISTWQLPLQE